MAPLQPERPALPLKLYLAFVVQGGANLVPWQVFIAPIASTSAALTLTSTALTLASAALTLASSTALILALVALALASG